MVGLHTLIGKSAAFLTSGSQNRLANRCQRRCCTRAATARAARRSPMMLFMLKALVPYRSSSSITCDRFSCKVSCTSLPSGYNVINPPSRNDNAMTIPFLLPQSLLSHLQPSPVHHHIFNILPFIIPSLTFSLPSSHPQLPPSLLLSPYAWPCLELHTVY